MEQAGQLWIPDNDSFFRGIFQKTGDKFDYRNLETALRCVGNFDFAVDGGAHVGSWTRVLSDRFKHVLAFEPEPTNYACLRKNVRRKNAVLMNAGLGEKPSRVGLHEGRDNTGMCHVHGEGETRLYPLDAFNIQTLDFLKLDVEGYELFALKGAVETIKRCSPVILIEENGNGKRYGVKPGDTQIFVQDLGYSLCARANNDLIYKRYR